MRKIVMLLLHPNPQIAEFLFEELAPKVLYLSNKQIGSATPFLRYHADFEARWSVLAGNQEIYKHPSPDYSRVRTASGNFEILANGVVNIRANNGDGVSSVVLGEGFRAHENCVFRAYIFGDNYCNEFSYSTARLAGPPVNTEIQRVSRPIRVKKLNSSQFMPSGKHSQKGSIQLFPNPSEGTIYYTFPDSNIYDYSVMDLSGRILITGKIGNQINSINLESLPDGVYLLKIESEGWTRSDRLILY